MDANSDRKDTRTTILDRLREFDLVVGNRISLYKFEPVVLAGFDQHAIANVLFQMEREGLISITDNNLTLLRPLP